MDDRLRQDYELFRRVAGKYVEHARQTMPTDYFELDWIVKCYDSARAFDIKFPSWEARQGAIQRVSAGQKQLETADGLLAEYFAQLNLGS